MTIVLPIAVSQMLVGSAVLVGVHKGRLLLATALHLLGEGATLQVALPPHQGDCSRPQAYPLDSAPALEGLVVATNPFADLALIATPPQSSGVVPLPKIAASSTSISVGAEVVVLGYPFALIGSFLETWSPAFISALGRRQVGPGLAVDELVLSAVSHPGSSGSAVVGKHDGLLYGILRGTLAPPESLRIGNIPIATDTSVTFATCAHLLSDLLATAQKKIDAIT